MARLALCAGWFLLVFCANYFTVGPLFDNANQADETPPMPPPVFKKLGRYKGGHYNKPTPLSWSGSKTCRYRKFHDQQLGSTCSPLYYLLS